MSRHGSSPAAGRTLLDEEVTPSSVSMLASKKAMLRQKTLFEYGLPTTGPNHERGLPKEREEFECPIQHSTPWGDNIVSGQQVAENGIFRLV